MVSPFATIHDLIEGFDPGLHIFRGVSNASFALKPRFGRSAHNRKRRTALENEVHLLNIFKERARSMLPYQPDNDFEWITLAQHFGLATRLLDWTRNPLVAIYFAVEDQTPDDGAIFAYKDPMVLEDLPECSRTSPFTVPQCVMLQPRHLTNRITAQSAVFTLHPQPDVDFSSPDITTIRIKAGDKRHLRMTLYRYGMNRASLFPDLDGISQYANWLCLEKETS